MYTTIPGSEPDYHGTSSGTGDGICEFTEKYVFSELKAKLWGTGTVTKPGHYSEQFLERCKLLCSLPFKTACNEQDVNRRHK